MMSQFVPQFAQVSVVQPVPVNLTTSRAPGQPFGLLMPATLAAATRSPGIAGNAFAVADNDTPRPLDRAFLTFSFFRVPSLPADPIDGAMGLSSFGAPLPGSTLGPGSGTAVTLLQQLPTAFPVQYSHYIQAALTQGNFVLANPDLVNGGRLLTNAAGNNFLTTANRNLLTANSSDARFQAVVSGALVRSGVTTAPINNLQIAARPFDRSTLGQLRTDPLTLYRETFGVEKTFLDGNASVGLRVPVFQLHDDLKSGLDGAGDLTVLLKYAFYNDCQTGNLLSAGLVVTTPTGPVVSTVGPTSMHLTLFQPYVGGIYHFERFYAQGLSSIIVPTDMREAVLVLSNLAIGYSLYSNPGSDVLTGVTPSFEAQFTNPLTHRGLIASPVSAVDTIVLSGGLSFTFNRLCVTVGASTPITGPHALDFGGFAQVNFVF
jgi:hypothetical protein